MQKGNIRLTELKNNSLLNIPPRAGVYWYESDKPLVVGAYKKSNPAGHYRGDPTVTPDKLEKKWVPDATTLYIGMASNLRKRIMLRARFADGEPVRAWGGRYLWQLDDSIQKVMKVRWEVCDDPGAKEREEIEKFKDNHEGRLPFANLVTPRIR